MFVRYASMKFILILCKHSNSARKVLSHPVNLCPLKGQGRSDTKVTNIINSIMSGYEDKIRNLLRADIYTELLESVDRDDICEMDVQNIAQLLPNPTIGGNFSRERGKSGYKFDRHALRRVFCDWFQFCVPQTHNEAVSTLLRILRDTRIGMYIRKNKHVHSPLCFCLLCLRPACRA